MPQTDTHTFDKRRDTWTVNGTAHTSRHHDGAKFVHTRHMHEQRLDMSGQPSGRGIPASTGSSGLVRL